MANHGNELKLSVTRIMKGYRITKLEEKIKSIFDLDLDFSVNEECFRKNTTSLGYESEAERCAYEVVAKHINKDGFNQIESIVEDIFGYDNGIQQFIIGNSNHCGDYTYEILNTSEEYIVVISYVC